MSTGTTCQECGMNCQLGEYHPFVACLIYKGCHDANVTRENIKHITQQWRDIGYREAENHIPSTGKMVGLTRITEQDAREIARSYSLFCMSEARGDEFAFDDWVLSKDGEDLLDKLNAGRADHIAEAGKMIDRDHKDYAIEHAEYMALNGEQLIDYLNEITNEEEGTIAPDDRFSDHIAALKYGIHGFRKRRDRCNISDHSVDANKMVNAVTEGNQ